MSCKTPFFGFTTGREKSAAELRENDYFGPPLNRAARILAGLGFDATMQARPLSELSGGWRMRVALAAVLFPEPDLLLLDEPTNHLDLEASLWLERYLRRYRHSFVLVSHDRQLLNAATTTTLHLADGKLTLYSGGFDQYLRARREAGTRQAALARRQSQERERLQRFVDRFRATASKARQAQSRVKALARLEPVALIEDAAPPTLRLPQPPELSPPIISLDKVSTGYAPGRPVLSRLDLRLDPDDRIALLGANGNGKTTFARLLAGRLGPLSGRMVRSPKLTCGFFAQHQIDIGHFGIGVPDHIRLCTGHPLEHLGGIAVSVRRGKNNDGGFHGFSSISYFSITVLASSFSHMSFRFARACDASFSASSMSITLPWRTSPTASKPRLLSACPIALPCGSSTPFFNVTNTRAFIFKTQSSS
jgi:ATPase subunit of ABC transporter with duplicated ATPase domains